MIAGTERAPGCVALVALGGLFGLLCAVFALVVTVADAWHTHVRQDQWPRVQATISRCQLRESYISGRGPRNALAIDCKATFRTPSGEVVADLRSRRFADPAKQFTVFGTPAFYDLQPWIDAHPDGSTTFIHYDPTDPSRIDLDNPPRLFDSHSVRWDLTLAAVSGAGGILLLLIGRALKPRS